MKPSYWLAQIFCHLFCRTNSHQKRSLPIGWHRFSVTLSDEPIANRNEVFYWLAQIFAVTLSDKPTVKGNEALPLVGPDFLCHVCWAEINVVFPRRKMAKQKLCYHVCPPPPLPLYLPYPFNSLPPPLPPF